MIGALSWSSINIGSIQIIQLVIGIILARILMPEDFGLIGVLYIFIGISTVLIDGGFGQGLIRKQDADQKDFSTIFLFNIFISICLYLLLYFTAPFIATFFSQPELTSLSRVLFLSVLLYPFYQIQLVQLLKQLDYKSIAIINIISVSVSGVLAATLALKGLGVWSLVYQQLAFHLIKAITFPFFLKWKPTLIFSVFTIQSLWRFSVPMLGQSVLNVIFNQIYLIIIGKFYPITQVGYFAQANKYSETVNVASQNIISSATFPLLAKIQNDKERTLRVYRKLITAVSTVTFPLVIFIFIAAEPIIITLITEKWMNSAILLQLLLIANIFNPMFTININILNAQGSSKKTLKLEIFKKSLILISILGCFRYGIEIMLAGFVVANILAYLISMVYIKQSLQHYYRHQILDLSSKLLIAVFTGSIVALLGKLNLHHLHQLILQIIAFALVYFVLIRIFFPLQIKEIFQLFATKSKS
ncbi:MAG: lipopolysaccharide biosynthesis protein [Paludibacter sp.]|nr:lipopolysaccharide biosynthesis protein [Paludibacter sp.]